MTDHPDAPDFRGIEAWCRTGGNPDAADAIASLRQQRDDYLGRLTLALERKEVLIQQLADAEARVTVLETELAELRRYATILERE